MVVASLQSVTCKCGGVVRAAQESNAGDSGDDGSLMPLHQACARLYLHVDRRYVNLFACAHGAWPTV